MTRVVLFTAVLLPSMCVIAQEKTHEMIGQLGSRTTLVVLHASRLADGGWQIAGEYIVLPTLTRRFLEGEASPKIGVTTLREGTTAILFGHTATAELRGTWRDGVFKGTRFAPGGQERERFEFSEEFPSMDRYSARVRCAAAAGRYASTLAYAIDTGKVQSFEWRSSVAPTGHVCALASAEQQSMKGGLRLTSGRCTITLRDLGDSIGVSAESCVEQCGSQAYLEALLVDRRGNCRLLRPEPR